MNFFSHAVVAAWSQNQPAFVLGAMIPDFASMIGAKKPTSIDPIVLAGIEFHERTDAVFHRAATFQMLQREARLALSAAGVRRGSDRAAAHVGIELLIDGELEWDRQACEVYALALDLALSPEPEDTLTWTSPKDALHFTELCTRLQARSRNRAPIEASTVADRVTGALARRPRLCLDWAGREAVRRWVELAQPKMTAHMKPLLDELIPGLRAEGLTFRRSDMVGVLPLL